MVLNIHCKRINKINNHLKIKLIKMIMIQMIIKKVTRKKHLIMFKKIKDNYSIDLQIKLSRIVKLTYHLQMKIFLLQKK
jgi:hypothetical protein